MRNSDSGGSSREPDPPERPLKKAKYLWQLKGKSHLKLKEQEEVESDEEYVPTPNKQQYWNHILKTADAVLDAQSSDDEDSVFSDREDSDPVHLAQMFNEVSPTLMPRRNPLDYMLKRWQNRQMARAYIDNTINSVMESSLGHPCDDVEDYVENCEDDVAVEDEGILMAIKAHGLKYETPRNISDAQLHHIDEIANAAILQAIGSKGISP